MYNLFDLVTDDDLSHYIDIWERSLYPKEINFNAPNYIDELKSYLKGSDAYSKLLAEALNVSTQGGQRNANLINEIFNYLDRKALN